MESRPALTTIGLVGIICLVRPVIDTGLLVKCRPIAYSSRHCDIADNTSSDSVRRL